MARYLLIKDSKVVNIIEADEAAAQALVGQYDSVELVVEPPPPAPPPPPPAPPPPPITTVSPVEFKLLFTSAERIAITAAKATDPVINDFFNLLDDPRLTTVNLTLQSTISAVNYLAQQNLIQADRVSEILSGQLV